MNHRGFPRAECKCLIKLRKAGKEKVVEAFTENIGGGGICVVLKRDPGLFEKVSLEVFLGEDINPIICRGTVVWVVKRCGIKPSGAVRYNTGIEFGDMEKKDKKRIAARVKGILSRDLTRENSHDILHLNLLVDGI